MAVRKWGLLKRLLFISYQPESDEMPFLSRAETQTRSGVTVTVGVPDAAESERLFGVPMARRGLQPVYLRVDNQSAAPLRLHFRSLDPHYYPPLEASARCHFSIMKRIYAFGVFAWCFFPFIFLMPLKLFSVHWANKKMDSLFQEMGFHRRPVAPGATSTGFVFTAFDVGTKVIRVQLTETGSPVGGMSPTRGVNPVVMKELKQGKTVASSTGNDPAVSEDLDKASELRAQSTMEFTFAIAVPGINPDYVHKRFEQLSVGETVEDCDLPTLVERLKNVSQVTHNHRNDGAGDPVNLVVIGEFETLLNSFTGRWDETEVLSLSTCWKTGKAFLLGSEYRYSPVSSLYLFERGQDIALQQIRQSISARLHLRLWLAPMTFLGKPVWIGQVSRDIGVRFTTAAWNLTTHRIDPDVDESRDYVLEDLLDAERVQAAGYVDASTSCSATSPRHNLTGDPYFTDGKRVVIMLSTTKTTPRFVSWG